MRSLGVLGITRASRILDGLKIEKSNLASVANRLDSLPINTAITIPDEVLFSRVRASKNVLSFRDIAARLETLYEESNLVSLLLDGYGGALTTDIKVLDSEITALEKALANYSFLLSDGGSFDFAFMEPFSDELNRDSFDWPITDRAGLVFSDLDGASVDTAEGTLKLTDNINVSYPLTGAVVSSNSSAMEISNTGIRNALDRDLSRGWRVSINSPRVINSTLKEFVGLYNQDNWTGAQYVVEFNIPSPAPADTITISPCSEYPFELTQVQILPIKTTEDQPKFILTAPIKINKVTSVQFPMQTVQRVRLYLRQDTFLVNSAPPQPQSETVGALLFSSITDQWKLSASGVRFGSSDREDTSLSNPSIEDFRRPWEVNTAYRSMYRDGRVTNPYRQVDMETTLSRQIADIVGNGLLNIISPGTVPLPTNDPLSRLAGIKLQNDVNLENPIVVSTTTNNDLRYMGKNPNTGSVFSYNFGIQLIRIGLGGKAFKGTFVTKPIPAPGDMGEVKLKTGEANYSYADTDKEMVAATFIEYSVTNKSNPKLESDWIPVMPIDAPDSIDELFLVDATGLGLFRFPASIDESVILYKNGYRVDRPLNDMLVMAENKRSIIGLKLPIGFATKEDNLICSYTPALDTKVLNFENAGLGLPPLAAAHDEGEAGEGFAASNSDLTVDLKFSPYIDYGSVDSSTYNSTYGLVPYQPIIVSLGDSISRPPATIEAVASDDVYSVTRPPWNFITTGNPDGQFTEAEYEAIANQFNFITINKQHDSNNINTVYEACTELKSRNPDLQVYMYFETKYWLAIQSTSWIEPGYDPAFDEAWFLHDNDGNVITLRALTYLDLANPDYRDWAIDQITHRFAKAPFDGVMFDSAVDLVQLSAGKNWDRLLGPDRLADYNDGMKTLHQAAKTAFPEKTMLFNGIRNNINSKDIEINPDRSIYKLDYMDGALDEAFVLNLKSSLTKDIPADIEIMKQYPDEQLGFHTNLDPTEGVALDAEKTATYAMAAFLMGWKPGKHFWHFSYGHNAYITVNSLYTFPDMFLNLGDPVGDEVHKGSVYHRMFDNGIVYLNVGSNNQSVTLPARAIHFASGVEIDSYNAGSKFVVPARSGIFFMYPVDTVTSVNIDSNIAINLTNYKGGDQIPLDPNADSYQYIHNQNVLLFNKAITKPFKVYYQYLANSVRIRVVLRSILTSFASPTVDWVQIKGKTRKPDPKRV